MKKLVLPLLLLFTVTIISQERVENLKITPNGYNGYVVKEFPSKSPSEIFTNLKKWAEYNIPDAEYANISFIENEFLEYNIYYPEALRAEDGKNSPLWDVEMNVQVRIKDNRVRFDLQIVNIPPSPSNTHTYNYNFKCSSFQYGFFNKKGEPRNRDAFARKQIENLGNNIISHIENGILGKVDTKRTTGKMVVVIIAAILILIAFYWHIKKEKVTNDRTRVVSKDISQFTHYEDFDLRGVFDEDTKGYLYNFAKERNEVKLIHEPDNEYSDTAIKVLLDNYHIGYVPDELTDELLPFIQNDYLAVIWKLNLDTFIDVEIRLYYIYKVNTMQEKS